MLQVATDPHERPGTWQLLRRACFTNIVVALCTFSAVGTGWASEPPNILLVIADDLNTDLGAYGHPQVQSPHIDALAKKGVVFTAAYNQFPGCNPSRSSFLTGVYPHQVGMTSNGPHSFRDIAPSIVSLPQYFRQHGYSTARVGKIFHYGVPRDIGTDGRDDPSAWDEVSNPAGIDKQLEDQLTSIYPTGKNAPRMRNGSTLAWLSVESEDAEHTDGMVASEAVRLLRKHDPTVTGKPFFIGVGFFRPHVPFIAPKRYFDLYPPESINPIEGVQEDREDIPPVALPDRPFQMQMDRSLKQSAIQAYYASVSFIDAQFGLVAAALEELGLEKNTIVVFMSDHGYQLGQHGLWQKGDLFEGSALTPLVIYDPRNKANGRSTREIVELVDLFPTLTALAGMETPEHLSGISFADVLNNPLAKGRGSALSQSLSRSPETLEKGLKIEGHTIRTPRYRFTSWANGLAGEELYDHEQDPQELHNVAAAYSYLPVKIRLQLLLDQRRQDASTPVPGVLDLSDMGAPLELNR